MMHAEQSIADEITILVVEDDIQAAKVIMLHLAKAGYATIRAQNGEEALRMAERDRPDAILLDILLPDIDGWDVLNRLKLNDATAEIPVIIISVLERETFGYRLGAVEHLVKPVQRDSLLQTLEKSLWKKGQSGKNAKILVVCEDLERLNDIAELLERAGYHVFQTQNGSESIELARTIQPRLIVIDSLLETMECLDVINALKKQTATSAIPVCVLAPEPLATSEKTRLDEKVCSLITEVDDTGEHLLETVNRCLTRKDESHA